MKDDQLRGVESQAGIGASVIVREFNLVRVRGKLFDSRSHLTAV